MAAGVVAQTLVSGFFRKQLKQQKPRCFHKRLVFYVSGGGEKQPQLVYLEPVAKGLHLTHWSSGDVAAQTLQEGIVPAVSARTVRRILREVDLQPHRTRYWKTSRLNDQFKRRAE